jgi:DNA-binding LytR/AlgR family response regulator
MEKEFISAIIIDDEPEAITLLEMYLRHFPEIKVTGKETNAVLGLEMVQENLPELVFLDIDMPDMNGLQVANEIQADNFYSEIIFTTAHQHYAYHALGIEPLDFLTKPFTSDDLERVIRKYKDKIERKKFEFKLDKFIHTQADSPTIKLPSPLGLLIVKIKDIVLIRAKANVCVMYLQDGTTETVNKNLYIVVRMLNSPAFFQASRSVCINLNYLQRVDKRNQKCLMGFNNTIEEVDLPRDKFQYFEKLNLFPII